MTRQRDIDRTVRRLRELVEEAVQFESTVPFQFEGKITGQRIGYEMMEAAFSEMRVAFSEDRDEDTEARLLFNIGVLITEVPL